MAYYGLRSFLAKLEGEGELARIKVEVDPAWEIGAIATRVFSRGGKALVFERVKGSGLSLVTGVLGTFKRYAMALGCNADMKSILERTVHAAQHPLDPEIVKVAACQEVIYLGDQVDMLTLPAPIWHPLDGGPFVGTLGVVIARDPDTGVCNAGVYREQVLGRNKIGLGAAQNLGIILKKYLDRGQPMPVATAIGPEPTVLVASIFHLPYGEDEMAVAGALAGQPIPLVKCKTSDLEVPANAEIIIEGEVPADPKLWESEGPFGEFTGYYSGEPGMRPSIDVKAVTTRAYPICQGTLEGWPPNEATVLRTVGHTTGAWLKLSRAGLPGFKAVYLPYYTSGHYKAIIALERQYYLGNARQAILAYWSLEQTGKWVVVVDDDIDIFDPAQVEWALATRVQPHRDIIVTSDRLPGAGLDPSVPAEERSHPLARGSRIGIDATTQFKGFDFPSVIMPRPEDEERVQARWQEYGIS